MLLDKTDKGLLLTVNDDERRELAENYSLDEMNTDNAMFEFFDDILANSEYQWVTPEECGALTDAPILGTKDENDVVVEAYGWMQYAVKSLLVELYENNEALLIKG